MTMKVLLPLVLILTGCAFGNFRYVQQPSAKMTEAQAKAECDKEVQQARTLPYNVCMDAKGWHYTRY
jgi:hypothetical protein